TDVNGYTADAMKLLLNSPARNVGIDMASINYDYNNSMRDGNPDMGALEYGLIDSDIVVPSAVSNLSVTGTTTSTASLTWTSPGDDAGVGTASSYDVRYSTATITTSTWASATAVIGEPTPSVAGTLQTMTVSGLNASTTYYFAMKVSDEVPNVSALSNIASSTTTVALADTTAPVISSVASTNVTSTGSTITWTTNESATSQVEYGPTVSYGTSTAIDASLVTSHSVAVSGLTSNTTYHFRVKSKDAANNEAISADSTFATAGYTDYSSSTVLDLQNFEAIPEEGTVSINIPVNPATAYSAEIILTLYDAENPGEGNFYINNNGEAEIPYGEAYDSVAHTFDPIVINKNYLVQGTNNIRFTHLATSGYRVEGVTIKLTFSGVSDTTPPYTSGHVPLGDAINIAPDANIIVHVKDDGVGVDINTIVMRVNGVIVTPVITGTPADYTLTYDPPTDFNAGQAVTVTVNASDLAP
ncbi:MAG: fibronectin type III domain-containing protein, partial [Candidatus Omnitrophota bacterium]